MNKENIKHIFGFTLIEILVVVGILGTVMVVSGVVLTNTLRTGNRVVSSEEVETAGTYILGELKRLILLSSPEALIESESCPYNSLELVNRFDESQIVLGCNDGKISSNSAQLHPDSIQVLNNCASFISCELEGAYPVINISFTLFKGDSEDVTKRYERSFESRVVMR